MWCSKKDLYKEISLIWKPLLSKEHPELRKFNSYKGRFYCAIGAAVFIVKSPFEEISRLATLVKKISDLCLIILGFVRKFYTNDNLIDLKQKFDHKWQKLLTAIQWAVALPIARFIVITRVIAAAILHPGIAGELFNKVSENPDSDNDTIDT